jgi:hypothetical protein
MRILWDLPLLQQGVMLHLEERAQDRLQAQRAWIRAVQHPAHRNL